MKFTVEIDPDAPEEILIRAKEADARLFRVREALEKALMQTTELALRKGESECYLSFGEVLFFEADSKNVYAHTRTDCFFCPLRLYEVEKLMPRNFARASKSCLVNTSQIFSIDRSPTGVSKVTFKKSEKITYISRMYYKTVREIIEETRLK